MKFPGQMGSSWVVVPSKQTSQPGHVANIHGQPCSHVAEMYNAFYPSSSRGNDTRWCGGVDVDGANPDSGVNKDFVVGKSSSFTRVSVAEAHSFFENFFRTMNPTLPLQ